MDVSVYLPLQFTTQDEYEYCTFMTETYNNFSEQGNYHFAYLAAHILLVYQIYLRLWQLAMIKPNRVIDALSMAHYDSRDGKPHGATLSEIVKNARSPMTFKIFKIEERVFVKILTLLDDIDYSPFKKAVDFRNMLAHPSGQLTLNDAVEFEKKLADLSDLMEITHDATKIILRDYIVNTMKQGGYVQPYVREEIERDIEQLFVSPLMMSAYDCALVSAAMGSDTKLETLIKGYLKNRADDGGYNDES